jgi:hypothetical protein
LRDGEIQRRKVLDAVLAGHQSFEPEDWHVRFTTALQALHQGDAMGFHPDYMNSRYRVYDEDKAALHALLVQSGTDPDAFWRDVEEQAMEFELKAHESDKQYQTRVIALKRGRGIEKPSSRL